MNPVIIFGGSGGIGGAIARRLVTRGDAVHLVGRDPAKLATLAGELGCSASVADVEDAAAIKGAVEAAADGGGLGGLVYAVGTINLKPLGALTDEDFARDWRVNALGAALAMRAAAPALKRDGGSVVLFSTVAVAQGFAAHASVSMAKGAIEGLALALAAELAPQVRVNCIAPSLTRTPLAAALTGNAGLAKAISDTHALRRLGEADDVAALGCLPPRPRRGLDHRADHRRRRGTLDASHERLTMRKKADLPTKICAVCGRPFAWRKKWARDWDDVRFCSDRCRGNRSVAAAPKTAETIGQLSGGSARQR